MSPIYLAVLCFLIGLLLTVVFGPTLLCLKFPHKWTPWRHVSIKYEERHCRRCLRNEHRKDAFWLRITAPPQDTLLFAETAPLSLVRFGTGTTEIPRLMSGALSYMPAPPRVAGDGHVVLDHG